MMRHEYHLLPLCGQIVGAYTGSGDPMSREEAEKIAKWLAWRLNSGWVPPSRTPEFDRSVKALCVSALMLTIELSNQVGDE